MKIITTYKVIVKKYDVGHHSIESAQKFSSSPSQQIKSYNNAREGKLNLGILEGL